jgi:glycerol-3-phosphate acyltransferase PlsY
MTFQIGNFYAVFLGYLLGSIPFGLILTRMAGLGDIRAIGSGNIGATNVLRTGNRGLAAGTLILDAGKAALAVLIARYFWGELPAMIAGVFAFLGHCFPVWLNFKGGKGVATYLGVLLGFSWIALLAAGAIWLTTAAVTRYSSLSALIATAATPPVLFLLGQGLDRLLLADQKVPTVAATRSVVLLQVFFFGLFCPVH